MHHINPRSKEVSPCRATKGGCPFDDGNSHFEDPKDAYLEAERRLEIEYGNDPTLAPAPMVEDFAEFQERMWGPPKGPELPIPTHFRDAQAYATMFPVEHAAIADYVREHKLTLDEATTVAEILKNDKDALKGGPSALVTAAMQKRLAESRNNIATLDAQLADSHYFAKPKLRVIGDRMTMETFYTVGDSDLITRVSEGKKPVFTIYDHIEGGHVNAYDPADFNDDEGKPLTSWRDYYNAYNSHINSRILWEKENRKRESRAGAVRL